MPPGGPITDVVGKGSASHPTGTDHVPDYQRFVAALARGEPDAQRLLHEFFWYPLVRYCRRFFVYTKTVLGYRYMRMSNQDAEEIVNEVLYKAMEKIDPKRAPTRDHLRSWLYTMAANKCRDWIRRNQHRCQAQVSLPSLFRGLPARWNPTDTARIVAEIVEELPEQYRAYLYLRYVYCYPVSEICRLLSVSKATVYRLDKKVKQEFQKLWTKRQNSSQKPGSASGGRAPGVAGSESLLPFAPEAEQSDRPKE